MRGRQPEPHHLKVLSGSKYAKGATPNIKPVIKMWRCPKHLGKHGSRMWKETGSILIKNNIMNDLDKGAFEALCSIFDVIGTCFDEMDKLTIDDARGAEKKNPYVTILNQYMNLFKAYAGDFGLTPASRNRMGLPEMSAPDPMDEFLD